MLGNFVKLLTIFQYLLYNQLEIASGKIFYFLAANTNKVMMVMSIGNLKVGVSL